MSVTRPTLIFLASGVDCELLEPLLEDSSSEPHPTATRPQRQSVNRTNRCTARRDTSFPPRKVMGPTKSGGSLLGLPVVRWICNVDEGTSEPFVRERALQRRPRHLDQFSLIHTKALARHGVL